MAELITADQLVARTLNLLSKAATNGVCKGRTRELIQYLQCISGADDLDPDIKSTCTKLVAEWQEIQSENFGKPVRH